MELWLDLVVDGYLQRGCLDGKCKVSYHHCRFNEVAGSQLIIRK